MSEPTNKLPPEAPESVASESRRGALAKLGLYAAYSAPLMLGMMRSAKALPPSLIP